MRLHQPSHWYGVASRELSHGTVDATGFNAGLYGLASGAEVLAHFDHVMNQRFLPSGRGAHPGTAHRGAVGNSVRNEGLETTEPRLQTLELNDIRMRVATQGSGPLVVMCHGFPELWVSWRHQMSALAAAGFRAAAPDMRGYGGTDAPADPSQYTMLHHVGDLVALVQALGEQQAGVAEAELQADVASTLRRVNFSLSGNGAGGVAAVMKPGTGFLHNTVDPPTMPDWVDAADLAYSIAETVTTYSLNTDAGNVSAGTQTCSFIPEIPGIKSEPGRDRDGFLKSQERRKSRMTDGILSIGHVDILLTTTPFRNASNRGFRVMHLPSRRSLLRGASAAAMACSLPRPGFAQTGYPARPVTLVVAYPAGGQNDLTARVVTQPFSGYWGQPVVVDNRAGAGGAIGAQAVARAAPDGYTLLLLAINHVILAGLKPVEQLHYDPLKDFTPVSMIAVFPILLVVNPSLPVNSVQQLIELAKKRPGELSFGSSGTGGGGHLAAELFCAKAGIRMLHVPYKGDAPALTDLISGQTSCMFVSASSAMPFVRQGKVRVLGISTTQRSALLPDVPTIAESDVPGYESNSWVGIVAPAGTPSDVVGRIHANVQRSLTDPAVKTRLIDSGGEPRSGSADDFRAFVQAESAKWSATIKAANVRVE